MHQWMLWASGALAVITLLSCVLSLLSQQWMRAWTDFTLGLTNIIIFLTWSFIKSS